MAERRIDVPTGYEELFDTAAIADLESRIPALRRAIAFEEAGVEARVQRLAGVFDNRVHPDCPGHPFHIHKLVFTGVLVDAAARPRGSAETLEADFHALDALPELSLGRTLPLHENRPH